MKLNLHYWWVMVVIATLLLSMLAIRVYIFGVFLAPLTIEFIWDRGALSGAYSLHAIITGIVAVFTGRLSDKYGPRILVTISGLLIGTGFCLMSQISSLWQVYLFWGLLVGIGVGCGFMTVTSTILRWFTKKRGTAVGITSAGVGLFGIISPPLAQWLIDTYNWQHAFIILGLITLIITVPLAQFVKHSPQQMGLRPYGEDITTEDKQPLASAAEGLSFNQVIKTVSFWLLSLMITLVILCVQMIIVHIVPYAIDIGILAMVAASILSIIAGSSLVGRLTLGFISDKVGARRALIACVVTLTLSLVWLLFAKEVWTLYLFAVIFGFAQGGMFPLTTVITAELFGLKSLGTLLGATLLFVGIGAVVGPILAGTIFDVTGRYNSAFIVSVVIGALAIIPTLILLRARAWRGG